MASPEPTSAFGCEACFGTNAEAAHNRRLEHETRLIDESHFGISIVRCTSCSQQFISIFTEFVDWVGGDDAQYCDIVPVTRAEAKELAAAGEAVSLQHLGALGQGRRRLTVDNPTGGSKRVAWAYGEFSVRPGH